MREPETEHMDVEQADKTAETSQYDIYTTMQISSTRAQVATTSVVHGVTSYVLLSFL